MNLEGRLIGNRYEILEKIGTGGMAIVYKARDHVLNRNIAVKVLKEEFTTDAEFVKRFNIEAQAAASLTHSNIVSIYDVGSEGEIHYIVMELVQGKTLKEIITDGGILPWKWTVNIAIQIASALEIAHRNNIVHRDIKPHNIIITEDGTAKVTDFGIAKAVSNSTITSFGATIGSVHYFSPEHARGGYTDAKSDIYSLGVVMYEMLTGKVPFDADTPVSVALKHMQENPVEPKKINNTIPDSVNKIIIKAMQKEPNLRYNSATEMLTDLRESIKNPNGNFVVMNKLNEKEITQNLNTSETKEKREKKKMKKWVKILIAVLICILVFVGAMFGTIKLLTGNRVKQVQVPSLVGITLDEAKLKLDELGLEYEITEEFSPEGKEAGTVISQEPKYQDNYKINATETMKLVVSKGLEMVTIPKVVGEKKEDAINILKEVSIDAEIIEENDDKVEEGIVIKQDPVENTEIAKNSIIKIYVSLGRAIKEVTVPYIIGKSEADAKNELVKSELTVGTVRYDTDTTKPDGIVLKQQPEADKTVDEQTPVTITVNKWPEEHNVTVNVKVPKFVAPEEDKNKNEVTNTVKPTAKKYSIQIVVGTDTIYDEEVTQGSAEKTITKTWKASGSKEVKVIVDKVTKLSKTVDLTTSDQTVDFSI